MSRAQRPKDTSRVNTLEKVRQLALAFPEAEEGTSYGTVAFKVRGKLFARLHQSGDAFVVKIDMDERTRRMQADPETSSLIATHARVRGHREYT